MTRAEIRLFALGGKSKIASFYHNSSATPDMVVPILMKALSECNEKREWQPFFRIMAENFDCDPVANTSYIYEVEMGYRIRAYETKYRDYKGGLWVKGKQVGEWTCDVKETLAV